MAGEHSINQVFIIKLTELLEANLENEHFGVQELAEAIGVSRSQLHRKIHAINNNSTSQFIREFRLQKAMVMLRNNVATVSEIAYMVGFSSPTYFNTCFRDYYGHTPGEVKYRYPLNKADTENIPREQQANPEQKLHDKAPTEKVTFYKRWVVLISLVLVIIITITIVYSYYIEPRNNRVNEPITHLENDAVEKTIAVLPIKNWSGDPELEYIGDGMTDAVIVRLAMIESMTNVIPFTSVLKYKNSDQNVPDIAEELGVQNILQGSFQLSGDQMKITLYLIDGPSNKHSWFYEYTGEWKSNEIFKIQAEIAENVAKKMNVEIKDEEFAAINKTPTQNKEAYNLWWLANFQTNKRTKKGWENAVPLYEKAIALDSTFFEAYVNLAGSYLFGGAVWGVYNEQEAWIKVKHLLQKATQIESTNVRVNRMLLNGSYIYEWDFDRMEKEYENSGMDGLYLIHTGRYEKSLAVSNQYLQKYAKSGFGITHKAQALFFLNRKEEAINLLQRNEGLFNDDMDYLREGAKWYFYMGEYKNSKALLNRIMTIFSDRPPIILWLNAVNEEIDGNTEGVNKYLGDLQKKYEAGESGSPAWFLALYYAACSDYENAFEWLQKAYDRHEAEMSWLREEPLLIPLRNDKRYLELYAKVGYPMEPHSTPE